MTGMYDSGVVEWSSHTVFLPYFIVIEGGILSVLL